VLVPKVYAEQSGTGTSTAPAFALVAWDHLLLLSKPPGLTELRNLDMATYSNPFLDHLKPDDVKDDESAECGSFQPCTWQMKEHPRILDYR
jgi:hypothetical protein